MEIYTFRQDITVFARPVLTFPNGIKEAFSELMTIFGHRAYFGISWFNDNGQIVYYAGAEKISPNEHMPMGTELLTILKGEYDTESVENWQQKTDQIKEVFDRLMADQRADKTRPCIEWYRSNEEMLFMINNQ